MRTAAMRSRDRGGDREPKSGATTGPGLVGAGEALERARQEVGREPRAFVEDVQLHGPVIGARAQKYDFSIGCRLPTLDQGLR